MNALRFLLGLLLASTIAAGPFQSPPTFTETNLGISGQEVRWGDANNDGLLDLAVNGFTAGGRFVRVYLRTGPGPAFTEHPNDGTMLGLTEGPVVWGDLDQDGDLDLASAGWSGGGTGSRVYRNNGASWAEISGFRGMKGADAAWFDFDHDGDLDVLFTGESYDTGMSDHTIIYRNNGDATFTEAVNLTGTYLGEVSVGDYDRDGDIDVAITGRSVGAAVYKNNGDGTFTDINAGLPGMINASIAWADFDNDGDLDLVLSGEDGGGTLRIDLYKNNNGAFVPQNATLPAMRLGHIAWGDYDNDGDLDMLMVGTNAGPSYTPLAFVYRNDGTGTFTDAGLSLTGVSDQSTCDWGDYDNDGDLDIVLSGIAAGGTPVVKVYTNSSSVANTAPTVPTAPVATRVGNVITFTWTASTDAQTPVAGLTYNLRVGTSPGGQQIMAPMADLATGQRRIPARGNAQQNLQWSLKNLPPGTYYWSVQAIDNGYLASGWSAEQSITIPDPTSVTAMTPAPGSTLLSSPATITVTLSRPVDPATVTTHTVQVIRGGNDGALDTGDDVLVVPAGVSVVGGNQIQISLAGVLMPNNPYRVRLSGVAVAVPATVGHWTLDEPSGTTAADTSGNLNTGTLVNGPESVAGKIGSARRFNGVDQEVVVADADVLSPHVGVSGEMSVSAWVRLTALPAAAARTAIVCKGGAADWEYGLFVYADGALSFGVSQPDGAAYAEPVSGPLTTGVWHHVAGTLRKGVSAKIWLDGIPLLNQLTFSGDTGNTNASLHIGNTGPDPSFEVLNGEVDDVRLFATELSAAQVRSLATLGGAVRDADGAVIDGEFGGSFPSGDGSGGGSFVADFTVAVAPLQVTAMDPAPGSTTTSAPADIVLTFNAALDPVTAGASVAQLVRAGTDQALGTGDDVVVATSFIGLLSANQIRIVPAGGFPNDLYRVTLSANPAVLSGRVNYWSFDEGSGPTAGDSAGGANGAIIGPVWVPGRTGNALHYNGASDTTRTGAPPLAAPWTAGMWVKREDSPSGDSRLLDPEVFAGGTLRLESFNHTNKVGIAVYGVADLPSGYEAPVGQWVHLTFVGTASNTQIYADGEQVAVINTPISVPRFFIGSHGFNTLLGTIDDLQIFGRSLTGPEVRTLASLGGAVRDVNGNRLDGEFSGSLPSGNTIPGGNFVATFTVAAPAPPGPFTRIVPSHGASGVSTTPTFTWNGSFGAATYTLEVATDSGFTSLVVNQSGIATTSVSPGTTLAAGTVHYWRVTAVNAFGATAATGGAFSFTTVGGSPAPPGPFTLVMPANGGSSVPAAPTYAWTAGAGASTYTLQVATDAGFANVVLNVGGITATAYASSAPLAAGTVHYWRVTAVNGSGSTVSPGAGNSFTTAAASTDIQVGGGCGLTGLEGIVLLGLLMVARRLRSA